MLRQIVGMGDTLEVPDVDCLVGRVDELSGQLLFQGVLGRETGRLLSGVGSGARGSRECHLHSAIGAAHAGGPRTGDRVALRLARQHTLPARREGRIGQAQQGTGSQQLEELSPTLPLFRETRA